MPYASKAARSFQASTTVKWFGRFTCCTVEAQVAGFRAAVRRELLEQRQTVVLAGRNDVDMGDDKHGSAAIGGRRRGDGKSIVKPLVVRAGLEWLQVRRESPWRVQPSREPRTPSHSSRPPR
jgi:hypothetical protein